MAACPVATQDIAANLANRQVAIDKARYGPLQPEEPNLSFWMNKAKMWHTTVTDAKGSRCKNCAAFIQTNEMLTCIQNGLGDEPGNASLAIMGLANLGYCEIFDFKCAGDRTCDAWVTGGPTTSLRVTESN